MRSLVLIAEDTVTVRHVRLAARHAAGLRVTAALDGRDSVSAALERLEPDVILIAHSCQRMNTVSRLREVAAHARCGTVLVLAARQHGATLDDAFGLGAQAVISADLPAAGLGALLSQVAGGHLQLGPAAGRSAPESGLRPPTPLRVVASQDAADARPTSV